MLEGHVAKLENSRHYTEKGYGKKNMKSHKGQIPTKVRYAELMNEV